MDAPRPNPNLPHCPSCGKPMLLARTVPRAASLPELRSFECRNLWRRHHYRRYSAVLIHLCGSPRGYRKSFLAERPKAMSRRLNEFLGVAPHRSTPATAFMLRLPIAPEACFEASAWRASLGVAIVVPIKEQPCAHTKCRWRGATPNYFHVRCGSYRTSARVAGRGRRQTMTGMALCVSTLRVSLPSTMADTPRRP